MHEKIINIDTSVNLNPFTEIIFVDYTQPFDRFGDV